MIGYTLALDSNWDLTLDAAGRIAVATGDYAIAQNCANAVRLFKNDACFNLDRGIDHYKVELGHAPTASYAELKKQIQNACLDVEGVESCVVSLEYDMEERAFGGEIMVTTESGANATLEI